MAFWWLVGQVANLSQCAMLAYRLVVFLIGLPNYLQRMYAFISDARHGWTRWYANTKKWFGDIFEVVLYGNET
jgi:hypothetical protein